MVNSSSLVDSELLHHAVEAQVLATPLNPAIKWEAQNAITYVELNESANQLAHYLRRTIRSEGKVIAICLDQSPQLIVTILAVLKIGYAWTPIDPSFPKARIESILESLMSCTLITSTAYLESLPSVPNTIALENAHGDILLESKANLTDVECQSSDLCHILWTSGSTGRPKGVMIEHRSVLNNCAALADIFGFHESVRTLQFASFTFDVFALDVFMTLGVGGCLVMGKKKTIMNDIATFIQRHEVNYAQLTPTVINLIDPSPATSMRILASSGEPMTQRIANDWHHRLRLFNIYGPTETDVCTAQEVIHDTPPSCVGKETRGCTVSIRDDRGDEVASGAIGEICVSGVQLMRGYLGISNPGCFFIKDDIRIYRTGDLGHMDAQRRIFCAGRRDSEVKVRGNRVNLTEVESVLAVCAGIKGCVAILPSDGPASGQLCAILRLFQTPSPETPVLAAVPPEKLDEKVLSAIRNSERRLAETLPSAAVPTLWWIVYELPFTTSGKVDRRSVRSWIEAIDHNIFSFRVPARGELGKFSAGSGETYLSNSEQEIRDVWSAVLDTNPSALAKDVSFFALGGHSIAAVRLAAAFRKGGRAISVEDIYRHDTIEKLAKATDRRNDSIVSDATKDSQPFELIEHQGDIEALKDVAAEACGITKEDIANIYPCSPLQEGLMAESLRSPGAYICRMRFSLKPGIDEAKFLDAWDRLVKEEAILRTRIILDRTHGMLQVVTHSPISACKPSQTTGGMHSQMALGTPLCHCALDAECSKGTAQFHVQLHHAICDGWQIWLMLKRLNTLYSLEGKLPLTPNRPSYSCFIKHILQNPIEASKFWLSKLENVAVTDYPVLPSPRRGQHARSSVCATIKFNYVSLAAQSCVPPSIVLQALWSIVYSQFADNHEVVYGVVHSGRDAPIAGIQDIVGPTISTTPFVARLNLRDDFSRLLRAHQNDMVDLIKFKHFGLQNIRKLSSSAKDACQFRALFVIQPGDDSPGSDVLDIQSAPFEQQYEYPLVITFYMRSDSVEVAASFENSVISEAEVKSILDQLNEVAQNLSQHGSQLSITELRQVSERVLERMVARVTCPPPVTECVHEIFEEAARRTPENPAIYDQEQDKEYSYAEVEKLSSNLALRLIQLGVGPEKLVPICIEKSVFALVAMTAVHKAGGAYVPIELSHPLARQQFIFRQTKAEVILCSISSRHLYSDFDGTVVVVGNEEVVEKHLQPVEGDPESPSSGSVSDGFSYGSSSGSNTSPHSGIATPSDFSTKDSISHFNLSSVDCDQSIPRSLWRLTSDLPKPKVTPGNVAFVLFTSGSTGEPKGVVLTHANIATAIHYLTCSFNLSEKIRTFQFSSFTFDMSLMEIYCAYKRSGCVCLPSSHSRMNDVSKSLREMNIDTVFATSTVASLFRVEDGLHLKTMVISGERLTQEVVDRWSNRLQIYQCYGPTESGISITSTAVPAHCTDLANIGPSITARLWILDSNKRPVPPGCLGEIAVSGPTVAREYLNASDKTRTAFIEVEPWVAGGPKQRLYLTGDVGRCTADGIVRIDGRRDHQVKIRGIRIELGEIENNLKNFSQDIQHVIVDYIHIPPGSEKVLVAFVCTKTAQMDEKKLFLQMTPASGAKTSELKAHQRATLPPYMVPVIYRYISYVPQTTSGKADRKALRMAFQALDVSEQRDSTIEKVAQSNEQQSEREGAGDWIAVSLKNLWRSVLRLPDNYVISPVENFFELGGDSFTAIRLVAAARDAGLKLVVRDIHSHPTLKEMESILTPTEKNIQAFEPSRFSFLDFVDMEEIRNLTGLAADDIEDIYPCTAFQEGLVALTSGAHGAYIARQVFDVNLCDEARFRLALDKVLVKNPILRTAIVFTPSYGALQVISKVSKDSRSAVRIASSLKDYLGTEEQDMPVGECLSRIGLIVDAGRVRQFVLTMSHAIYDGWSQNLLLQDLQDAYESSKPLSLVVPFSAYIAHTRRTNKATSKSFWENYLENASGPSFPHAPREGAHSNAESVLSIAKELKWSCTIATKATILQAAWAFLLSRYENTSNPCFGMILSGRDSDFPGIEQVRGPTMAAVPAHVVLKETDTVRELLQRVRKNSIDSLPHANLGLQHIKDISEDARNACGFRTMLVVQPKGSTNPAGSKPFELQLVERQSSMAHSYPITVECMPSEESISLSFFYDEDWVNPNQVARMSRHFLKLIEQMSEIAMEDAPLSSLSLLTEEDMSEIYKWNEDPVKPVARNIYDMFLEAAKAYPDSPAVDASLGGCLTYKELDVQSAALANVLKASGVRRQEKVPICMRKSAWTIIAILAILKLNATYVPIDATWPALRIQTILQKLEAKVLLTDSGLLDSTVEPEIQRVYVEEALRAPQEDSSRFEDMELESVPFGDPASDLAYVLFTSGSTGEPKGVMISHLACCTALDSLANWTNINNETRIFQFASLTFDASVLDILGCLIRGGCICIPSDYERLYELPKAINNKRANWIDLTPSVVNLLSPTDVPTLKTMVVAGESVPQALMNTWTGKIHLINSYGPTETTIITCMRINDANADPYNIGSGIGTTSLWITEPRNPSKLAAVGAVGELICIGPSIFNGYLRDEERTRRVRLDSLSWVNEISTPYKAYRTGDLVRYNNDGSIRILGRADFQVKLRGQRLELAEIDTAIKWTGQVITAATELLQLNGRPALAAFVSIPETASQDDNISHPLQLTDAIKNRLETINEALKKSLPPYMCPSAVIPMNRLPYSSSGKLDRRYLRQIAEQWAFDKAKESAEKASHENLNATEKTMQELWANVLKINSDMIGLDDDFFKLGGDSIAVISLVSRARSIGHALDVKRIYQTSKLKQMAKILKDTKSASGVPPFALLKTKSTERYRRSIAERCQVNFEKVLDIYPMLPLQGALLSLSEKLPGVYVNRLVYSVDQTIDPNRLEEALSIVVRRQPILQTRLLADEGECGMQVVIDQTPKMATARNLNEALQIQLGRIGPTETLVQFYFVPEGNQTHFVIIIHHALMDGWSIEMFITELQDLYEQGPDTLHMRRTSFSTFVEHVGKVKNNPETREFWKEYLSTCDPTAFPPEENLEVPEISSSVSGSASCNLKGTSVTTATIISAALAILLSKHSMADEICFGMTLSGRTEPVPGIQDIAGPTICTVPVIAKTSLEQPVGQFLQTIHNDTLNILSYQQYGLQNIRKVSDGARKATNFKTLLVIQPFALSTGHSQVQTQLLRRCLEIESQPLPAHPLEIECRMLKDKVDVSITFDGKVIGVEKAQWLLNHYIHLIAVLGSAVRNEISLTLGEIEMFTAEDLRQINDWNSTKIPEEKRSLHQYFRFTSQQYPDETAVESHDMTLSYNELDKLSSALAAKLVGLGIRPGQMIAMAFEKSSAMIVAMIGTLKAGAAYVPLDINHPLTRLEMMITEIKSDIIICSSKTRDLVCSLKAQQMVVLDESMLDTLRDSDEPDFCVSVDGSGPAYVLFTSGSTGTPKGVVLPHTAVTISIREQIMRFGFVVRHRVLNFCSYTFDVSVMEIFATLCAGGCLLIPSEEQRMSALPTFINDKSVQTAVLTPTAVSSLLTPDKVPNLQQLILVGEPATQRIISIWSETVHLVNDYGPTETAINSVTNTCITKNTKYSNVGYAIAAHLWITDQSDPTKLCPLGVTGELLISGPTLAKEYLNDPAKTNTAFLAGQDLPWAAQMHIPPQRLYRTGDLAYYGSGGCIHILGRIDTQIKLRGLRIEIREVEHAMESHPAVAASAVDLLKTGEDSLVCFVQSQQWAQNTPDVNLVDPHESVQAVLRTLAAHAASLLPQYMLPSLFLPITKLPTNSSGKLDRRRLRRLVEKLDRAVYTKYLGMKSQNAVKGSITTDAEAELRDAWAQVLGIEPATIDLDDSFFVLGGDSLSAMRLASTLSKKNLQLSVISMFKYPKLKDMAERLVGAGVPLIAESNSSSKVTKDLIHQAARALSMPPQSIEDIYPCSPLQESIYALSLLSEKSYTARFVFRLDLTVSKVNFRASWEAVYQRHKILRTRIIQAEGTEGKFLQVVCRENIKWQTESFSKHCSNVHPGAKLALRECFANWVLVEDNGVLGAFILTLHHSLYDATSLRMIFEDFFKLYRDGFQLEPPPPTMKHYIRYQEGLSRPDMIAFWKEKFSGINAPPFPPKAISATRALTNASTEIQYAFTGSSNNWRGEMTPLIRTAWALAIARHTIGTDEEQQVAYGTILSGRGIPIQDVDRVAGPLIVAIPLVKTIKKSASAQMLLAEAREEYIGTMDYEHFGLSNIRRISSDCARACGFNNLLVIQKESEDNFTSLQELGLFYDKQDSTFQQPYGLVLECAQVENGIAFSASYDTNQIASEMVNWILLHFGVAFEMLTYALEDSEITIEAIFRRFLTQYDRQQMLRWNPPPQPKSNCLHDLFVKAAQKYPSREAVFAHDRNLTYTQLDLESSILAQHLISLGVQAETFVPICFEKGSYMIVAQLGILKAGGAYAPIAPDHPPSRRAFIVQQCRAKVALASKDQASFLQGPHDSVAVICVDDAYFRSHSLIQEFKAKDNHVQPNKNSAAYILHTSGSTGKPKGVVVEHGSIHRSLVEHAAKFGHGTMEAPRSLQFCSYTFDVSVMDIFATLSYGGCVCVPSEQDRRGDICSFVNSSRAQIAMLTPTVANMLNPEEIPGLEVIVIGGEPLTRSVIQKWANPGFSPRRPYNVYGPTEASVNVSACPIALNSNPALIGKSILGSQLWIVEPSDVGQLAPLGCVGELVISGPCVARGYLNDPDKTNAAFVNTLEWLPEGYGDNIYRTGDLARFTPGGTIEYIGRMDDQVKLHGIRIEPGEIESSARQVQGVKEAVALLAYIHERDTLALFIEPDRTSRDEFTVAETVKHCLQTALPPYMIPRLYIPVDYLPLTNSGKIDRSALKQRLESLGLEEVLAYQHSQGAVRQPRTNSEKLLQSLWAEILHVAQQSIGLDSEFFAIGGDSITAIRLVSGLKRAGISTSYQEVYAFSKLEQMAKLCEGHHFEERRVDALPFQLLGLREQTEISTFLERVKTTWNIQGEQIEDAYPCAHMQEALLAASTKAPGSYRCVTKYSLPRNVDIDSFITSWEQVVEQNEILRTRIICDDVFGNIQIVLKNGNAIVKTSEMKEPKTGDLMEMGLGTSLCSSELMHEDSTGNYIFKLVLHHAIYDRWVLQELFGQLRHSYYNEPSLPTQAPYKRFIEYEQREKGSKKFWELRLSGAQVTEFPELPCRMEHGEFLAESYVEHEVTIPQMQVPCSISLATIIHCAYALVLSRYTQTTDVCFASVQSGRNIPVEDIDRIAGPTISTIFVRTDLAGDAQVAATLSNTQSYLFEAIPHQHTSLLNIQNAFGGRLPEISNMLVIQPRQDTGQTDQLLIQVGDTSMLQLGALLVECNLQGEDSILLTAMYSPNAMSSIQAQWFLRHLGNAITQFCASSSETFLRDLSIASDEDIEFADQHCGEKPQPQTDKTVSQIFKHIVQSTPSALAVDSYDGTLTYSELNDKAVRLAFYLLQLTSASPENEAKIPACFEKGVIAIIVEMAIFMLKDVCFVPLDPDSPASRNQNIIDDVGANIVLASPTAFEAISSLCSGKKVVKVDVYFIDQLPLPEDGASHLHEPQLSSIAYILFTSGSTGRPKGCIMEHGPLATTIIELANSKKMVPGMRTVWSSRWTFDSSLSQILEPLCTGGVICIPAEQEMHENPIQAMNKYEVNHAFFTPSLASTMNFTQATTLRSLVMGGEPINFDVQPIINAGIWLINEYGPSEGTIAITTHTVRASEEDKNNIGRPVSGGVWVVNPENPQHLAAIGTIGELVIGGNTLARGYLNQHELTSRAFLDRPSWTTQTRRIYRTGDLVRQRFDGTFQYIGRKDSQVKINGVRIELSEIEARISILERSIQPVVSILSNTTHGKSLVAFLSSKRDSSLVEEGAQNRFEELCRRLQQCLLNVLPHVMVPRIWIPLDSIPLTPTGKVDRKALQAAYTSFASSKSNSYVPDKEILNRDLTPSEAVLRRLWALVLRRDEADIKLTDDFFNFGDSIRAIQLVGAAGRVGYKVSVRDVFKAPTLAQMATLLNLQEPSSQSIEEDPAPFSLVAGCEQQLRISFESICTIPSVRLQDIYPMSHTQVSCFVETQKWHRSYYAWFVVGISGPIDADRLSHACQQVLNHHPILRSVFFRHEKSYMQAVLAGTEADFATLLWPGNHHELPRILENSDPESLNLGKPMTRFRLVSNSEEKHRLAIGLPHAKYDGVCLPIILDDIRQAYHGAALQSRPSFARFIRYLQRKSIDESYYFWREALSESAMTRLVKHRTSAERPLLDNSVVRTIAAEDRIGGVNFSTALTLAWAMVLATYTGDKDIVFGSLVSGRNVPVIGIDEIVGPCINILPVRVKLDEASTIADLLNRIQRHSISAMPHEVISLLDLVKHCTDWPSGTRFSSIIQHQNIDFVWSDSKGCSEAIEGVIWEDHGSIAYSGACDEVDVWVTSLPVADSRMTISLLHSDSSLPRDIAQKLLDGLCDTIEAMQSRLNTKVAHIIYSARRESRIHLPHDVTNTSNKSDELGRVGGNDLNTTDKAAMEVAEMLRSLWCKVLDLPQAKLPLEASFFDVGGESVSAAILADEAAKEGLGLSLQDVFDHPTLQSQALKASNCAGKSTARGKTNRLEWDASAVRSRSDSCS